MQDNAHAEQDGDKELCSRIRRVGPRQRTGPSGVACQAAIAPSVNQSVKLPRWRKLAS
nr:hypothetical protein [uncultured Rhodopila sp.]